MLFRYMIHNQLLVWVKNYYFIIIIALLSIPTIIICNGQSHGQRESGRASKWYTIQYNVKCFKMSIPQWPSGEVVNYNGKKEARTIIYYLISGYCKKI